jgi:hypothetical protein
MMIESSTFKDTVQFNKGTQITIDSERILIDNMSKKYVDINSIDNFKFEEVNIPRIKPLSLMWRLTGVMFIPNFISYLLTLITNGYWTISDFIGILGFSAFVYGLLIFIFIMDKYLQLNIFNRLIRLNFSDSLYLVIFEIKNDDLIQFYAEIQEKNKLIQIKNILNLKQTPKHN